MGWGLIDQDIKSLARHGRASRAGRALRQTAAAPGQPDTFELLEHDGHGAGADRRFAAIAITHEMANNLGTQAAQILRATDVEQGSYRNRFSAAPAALGPGLRLVGGPGPPARPGHDPG